MVNGDKGAFCMLDSQGSFTQYGLTKREYFAGLAMQGLLASMSEMKSNGGSINMHIGMCENLAIECVDMADALLKELDNE